ncbi:YhgE/Pip family protein [Actinokineospora globicatena]|uniref:YhgE/Pip family protein n=1 Tax=Actinokineospora globicatena TaxID=103729 RepID=UPI0020A49867|nr:YhgE/Pip domain-containing protein [Actinokineospora globicatena]MCP2304612.1 putative membrane protein [Actinokineospora globicatena]GLW78016.1 ABC transporter [Actinokineospora globicatena]GLW85318.1 ABC transporter [Actinokineospora globicatena]
MSVFRLARNELRRVSSGTLPKLAVLALVLVPLLYGSLYLYANADPYNRLDKIPAALVVTDKGVVRADGSRLDAGRKVADQLAASGKFDWHEVDAKAAEDGVRSGQYTFSITLPGDFSASLASSSDFAPRQGMITVTTNDANNYLVGTIADRVVSAVRESVATSVGTEAAEKFLVGFGTVYQRTQQAADGAARLADGATQASTGATRLAEGQRELADGATQLAEGATTAAAGTKKLSTGLDTLQAKTKDLPAQATQLATGARKVATGDEQVARTAENLSAAAQAAVDHLDELDSTIEKSLRDAGLSDSDVDRVLAQLRTLRTPVEQANTQVRAASGQLRALATGADQVADGAELLATAAPALAGGISDAAGGARELATGTTKLREGAVALRDGEAKAVTGTDQLAEGTKSLSDGSVQLRDGLTAGLGQIPHPDDATRDATAKTIGDPVSVHTVGENSAGSYGAGLAPFFLGLALWIGAFVLFLLIRPLSARALAAGHPAARTALAGWLTPAALGVAQVVIMFAVVTTLIGIHPARPLATLGFLVLTSLTFVSIVHALNAFLGPVGKFVALVVLILQLISAGGTFPWQTLPDALIPLHRALPMGYVVDGLRHLLYGGASGGIGTDVGVLLAYLIGGLVVSTLAARRQRVWTPARLKPELVL